MISSFWGMNVSLPFEHSPFGFAIMITIALSDNDYHYEKISQIYAELLYLNAILLKRKKENVSAYSFISLAINILKVFFVSNKPVYDIRTYYIYSLCLLMLIQMLIEDKEINKTILIKNSILY